MKKKFFYLFYLFQFFSYVLSIKYPKNKNITKLSKYKKIKSIEIQNINELLNYIQNFDYIIVLFYQYWCGNCQKFIQIFDKASQYKIIKNFKFLKINCDKKEICNSFNINKFPTIKIYIKKNEFKTELIKELIPLLEFLEKISNNPLIKIKNELEFYNDYGTFSPIVEYKEKNNEFISCISMLANKDFLLNFYFGIKIIDNNEKYNEKIKFDFDGMNVEFIWNGNCSEIKEFLNYNIFPIINEIDANLIKIIQKNPRILILLFYEKNNLKQIEFIQNQFKKISFDNRKFVFGYAEINEEIEIANFFKIKKLNGKIKIVIYDYVNSKYYIHNKDFDLNLIDFEKTEKEIRELINNIDNLIYITGNFFNDIFLRFGINHPIWLIKFILIICIIIIILIFIFFILLCDIDNKKLIHIKSE